MLSKMIKATIREGFHGACSSYTCKNEMWNDDYYLLTETFREPMIAASSRFPAVEGLTSYICIDCYADSSLRERLVNSDGVKYMVFKDSTGNIVETLDIQGEWL